MAVKRPDWWEDWIPVHCPAGHELLPGLVRLHWVHCDCPGAGPSRGHHYMSCHPASGERCEHQMWPPEHTGPIPQQG